MTDKDRLTGLLDDFKVPYDEDTEKDVTVTQHVTVTVDWNSPETVVGYSGFFANFEFDADGRFIRVGIWE